ncbi:hypothetical protein ACS0TY_014490 [Phlomoides rotata]
MAKCLNAEFSLPEHIIHYIQTFLTGKEAAQTTVLSKSWYSAWLTRPNLDFDQSDFNQIIFGDPKTNEFSIFSKKTLRRYQDSNLKIESFKLRIRGWERAGYALAYELIVKAIEIGATDIDFELCPATVTFSLPHGVLGSETLTRLSVKGCKIEDVKVRCSRLKSLILRQVWLEGDMIWGLLSSCPLIEDLVLPDCKCFTKVQNSPYNNYITTKRRMLALTPSFEIVKQYNLGSGELQKLKCLFLEKAKITTLFFSDFSSKFPCLKNLVVHYCFGYKDIQIYSPSLETISFAHKSVMKANFDVPNIRKFSFSGCRGLLPSLAFQKVSRKWESNISVCCQKPSYAWFFNLNKLLANFCSSTIYLSIDFQYGVRTVRSFDFTGETEVLPAVQNLTLHASHSVCYKHLDGIFWSCRPKFIILHWLPGLVEQANEGLLALLFMKLTGECVRRPLLYDLKEVKVVEEQHPLPEYERTICFQLKWEVESSIFF